MMTPIETQPTVAYSVAVTLPGTSLAGDASAARFAGSNVVAANTDEKKTPVGGPVGQQQLPIAGTLNYPSTSGQEPPQFQLQSQAPPPYAAVVQQQQQEQQQQQPHMTSVPLNNLQDRQVVLLAPGAATAAAAGTAEPAAAAAAATTVWMPKPIVTTLCPPGLEYLAELNQMIFVEEFPTNLTPQEYMSMGLAPRRFAVRNEQGQQIYLADTSKYETAYNPVLGFADSTGQVLMTATAKRNGCPICCTGKCQQCLLDGTVEAPLGTVLGTVEQQSSTDNVTFVIKNTEGSPVLYLVGPNPCSFCSDCNSWLPNSPYRPFAILSLDRRHQIGKIEAIPSYIISFNERLLTNITLAFPADLDVKVKATLAGAATMMHRYFFLIAGESGINRSGYSTHNRTRPINSTSNQAPRHFQHHHNYFHHHHRHFGGTTSHFSTGFSRSSHHSSSHHTSHHGRRH